MSDSRLIVVALGGNAVTREGETGDIPAQFHRTARTVKGLVQLIVNGHRMIITHGNGPQVGQILRRVEIASKEVYPLPLDICVADSQGGMGYMIAQCLSNELRVRGVTKRVISVITTVLVDGQDKAFVSPTKPIGSVMDAAQAQRRRREDHWEIKEVQPGRFRRVVASPKPLAVLEQEAIKTLINDEHLVIACGGGGIPVAEGPTGAHSGVAAVVDKDRATAILARQVRADCILILTAIDKVYLNYGTDQQQALDHITLAQARTYLDEGHFAAGSMGPKIEASIDFLSASTKPDASVVIADTDSLLDAVAGRTGTRITK